MTVGGAMARILQALLLGPLISLLYKKKIRILALKPNRDLAYINELYDAGNLKPVLDGPFRLSEVPAAIRYFSEGNHKGKIIITMEQNGET